MNRGYVKSVAYIRNRHSARFSISGRRSGAVQSTPSYWGAHSYYPRGLIMGKGNSLNFQYGWHRGVWVPWAFKLEHLQPVKPILFWKFSNFFTFILGAQFLLTQRANKGNCEFFRPQNWTRQRVFSAWDIQTGPFASLKATFVPKNLQLFHFHTGEPILITPEGQ